MIVARAIYLSRRDDLHIEAANLEQALFSDAAGATEIVVLSAYYEHELLSTLFRQVPRRARSGCRVRLVVGTDQMPSLARTFQDLRDLRDELKKVGFRDIAMSVFRRKYPFHTKLYYFLHHKQPIWYIGSANASRAIAGERHELMLRLSGRHTGLKQYIEAVMRAATSIDEERATHTAQTLREFFLSGSVCYSPPAVRLFTFDAFKLTKAQRERLRNAQAQSTPVAHADPKTEGFGFSLTSALDIRTVYDDDDALEKGSKGARLKYRHLGVETALGIWIPAPYVAALRLQLAAGQERRQARLLTLARKLNKVDPTKIRFELDYHVETMTKFFGALGMRIRPVRDMVTAFNNFLSSRIRKLSDSTTVEHLSRGIQMTRMPDIWSDLEARTKFEQSFFDECAYKWTTSGRRPHVVKVLLGKIGGYDYIDAETIRENLENHLERTGWRRGDWGQVGLKQKSP